MKKTLIVALVTGIGLLSSWAAAATDFSARVVTVHEGDRLLIYHAGKNETVYLQDIDCPELKQPHGRRAKHVTQAYVGGREVLVRNLQRDKHGRATVEIILPNGRNLGHELLKEGLAWWRKFDSKDRSLGEIETLVQAERKGLWADPNPVPPWKWTQPKKLRR